MNFIVYIVVLVVVAIVLMGLVAKLLKDKVEEGSPIMVVPVLLIIGGVITLGVWTPRMYVVEEVDGELTTSTKAVFFGYTHTTEDGEEIEIEPVSFGCSVLNLTDKELIAYPIFYGPADEDDYENYYIYPYSFEATNEWNLDYLPPDYAPDEITTEADSEVHYALEESY